MRFKERIWAICTAGPSDPTRSPSLRNRLSRSGLRTAEIFATRQNITQNTAEGRIWQLMLKRNWKYSKLTRKSSRLYWEKSVLSVYRDFQPYLTRAKSLEFTWLLPCSQDRSQASQAVQQRGRQGLPVVVSLSFTNSAPIVFSSIFILLRGKSDWPYRIVFSRAHGCNRQERVVINS